MGKKQFEQACKDLYEKMLADGEKNIIQYKPFSDEYWNQNPKVVICNYEAFAPPDTVHFSAVFANALLKILHEFPSTVFSRQEMRKSFWQYKDLYQNMSNVMYMNLRPTWAKGNKQETGATHEIINKYKKEIKAYLDALDADIFVLSTKDAVTLFNSIFDINNPALKGRYIRYMLFRLGIFLGVHTLNNPKGRDMYNRIRPLRRALVYKKSTRVNKTMVFSVKHFGRPDYKYWHGKALEIAYHWYHR